MRQGQQNRRGRGRGGRKGQSPLSRSFESSGPDIKIRGTAQHIAEKYMALARDAIGSGDLVLGENYLQHAEHYNRIIMAAQTLPQGGYEGTNGNGQRIARPEGDLPQVDGLGDGYDGDDDGEGDQPGVNGGNNFDQQRQFDGGNQRDHQNQQTPRNRDGRNFEHRNYDNRRNEPRHFEPRGQGGHDQRGNYEPRFQDQPRFVNPNTNPNPGAEPNNSANSSGDQPVGFDQPRQFPDNRDERPVPDSRPNDPGAPRGRRRRGRHENGANRPYPPQVANSEGNGEGRPAGEPNSGDSGERSGKGNGEADGQD
jgi:hypothetical protein